MNDRKLHMWIDSLDVHGVTGWRLPHAINYAPAGCRAPIGIGPGQYCVFTPEAGANELADLYAITLGNGPDDRLHPNTGNFVNAWLRGVEYATDSLYTGPEMQPGWWGLITYTPGSELIGVEEFANYDWAVHDGDIAAVPEPQTVAMLGLGLPLLAWKRRRQRA